VRDLTAASIRSAICLAIAIALAFSLVVKVNPAAAASEGTPVVVQGSDVTARISLSSDHASPGHQLGVAVNVAVAPGWHIYGEPLPEGEGLTPTSIKFDGELLARQQLNLPKPTPLRFEILNQTYPVYTGNFRALGNLVLNPKIKPGDYSLPGTFNFQLCNDSICKPPQAVRFELPIKIDPSAPSASHTSS
jgi:DsbC/DsbD-like thiol-disulfide interchange protein